MHMLRRRASKTAGAARGGQSATPPWMRPLPTGPVVFDPSLRRAAELTGQAPVATMRERRRAGELTGQAPVATMRTMRELRPSERSGAPEPPLHPRGHAA